LNILLLEDTYTLREQIAEYFSLLGHDVTECSDGDVFFEIDDYRIFDLFLLDLNVPNYSGLEILEFLHNEKIETPKVVITASADIASMKNSFQNGCCEYVKKPFSLEELEVRISRFFVDNYNLFEFAEKYIFDKEKNHLLCDDKEVKLTKIQKRIILYLITNRGRTCSVNEIIEYVTPDKLIDFSTLASHIKNIRQATTPNIIETLRGEGYRIV